MSDKKSHWEKVYQNKSPLEVSWYQKEPTLSLQLIERSNIALDAPMIDIGGGASVLVDRLIDKGYSHLSVLDLSITALKYTQQRLGQKAHSVEWIESDITQFEPPHPFFLWHDRAVFHFLTDPADQQCYVKILKQAHPVGSHLIIAAFAIGGPTRCSDLEIVQYSAEKMAKVLDGGFELIGEASENHQTPANKAQQFNYFHWVRTAAS